MIRTYRGASPSRLKKQAWLAEDWRPRPLEAYPQPMPNSRPHSPEPTAPATAPGPVVPEGFQPMETEGFPWTGLTLVLVVLGLIAFMAVPSVPISAEARAAERRETAASLALSEFRAGIRDYYHDHHQLPGTSPRASTELETSPRWLRRQLMLNTDDVGNPSAGRSDDHPHGPYLPVGIPSNPINGLATVKFASEEQGYSPDGSTGWIFFEKEGVVRLNSASTLRGSSQRYYDL